MNNGTYEQLNIPDDCTGISCRCKLNVSDFLVKGFSCKMKWEPLFQTVLSIQIIFYMISVYLYDR